MPTAVRQINESRALACLLNNSPMSRADLARELKLTRSTASSIAASLIEAGKLVEIDETLDRTRARRTGRPAILLEMNPDHALYLGMDIGARYLRLCGVDFLGRVRNLVERRIDADSHAPEVMVGIVAEMIDDFCDSLPDVSPIRGLNVSVPGLVDLSGHVLRAPPLGWKSVPLRSLLSARLSRVGLMQLHNDANAFAIAELALHSDDCLDDVVFLLIEDGIGGCVISDGRIIKGHQGFAGEIGHIPIGKAGFCNVAGLAGAFENFTARGAVLARFRDLGGCAEGLSDFMACLDRGDRVAHQVISDWARYLGRGIAVLAALLNPQTIILGGRVSELFRYGREECMAALKANTLPGSATPNVVVAEVGPEGPAVGCALALHGELFANVEDLTVNLKETGTQA